MRDGGINFGTIPAKKKEEATVSKKEIAKKEITKPKAEKLVKAEPADAGVSALDIYLHPVLIDALAIKAVN